MWVHHLMMAQKRYQVMTINLMLKLKTIRQIKMINSKIRNQQWRMLRFRKNLKNLDAIYQSQQIGQLRVENGHNFSIKYMMRIDHLIWHKLETICNFLLKRAIIMNRIYMRIMRQNTWLSIFSRIWTLNFQVISIKTRFFLLTRILNAVILTQCTYIILKSTTYSWRSTPIHVEIPIGFTLKLAIFESVNVTHLTFITLRGISTNFIRQAWMYLQWLKMRTIPQPISLEKRKNSRLIMKSS